MLQTRLSSGLGILTLALISALATAAEGPTEQEAYQIAKDAYIYAYPMMLDYMTMRQSQNYAVSTGIVTQSPFNQFTHAKAFTPVDLKTVVRPNQDTLYSSAGLDLAKEPLVLSVPATQRYFMLPLMSLWTDIYAVPGTRTTGRDVAHNFLIVGPRWNGAAPAGMDIIHSPTRYTFIIGRTQTNSTADYDAVHKVQAGFKLTPLSAWGKGDYVPPKGKVDPSIDMKTLPPVQVRNMDAASYFGRFAELLKDNPPGPFDYPIIHQLERVGFRVGSSFDLKGTPATVQRAFERGQADGKALVTAEGRKASGIGVKGWAYSINSGVYGTSYSYRAAIADCCLGENLPQDAIYPSVSTDSDGEPLDGSHNYVLHFDQGKLPPADAFWSVTAYDTDGYFIPNAINRQLLGSRDKLATNADGSLDLIIQSSSPESDKKDNWLPVAKAPFALLLRLYSPKAEVIEGNWIPPSVHRMN